MSSGKKTNSSGYLSKIIERESRLQSKNNNNILKPIQKPITLSNINTQIYPSPSRGTEGTISGEFQKADKQQNHTPLISEAEEKVASVFSSSSSSSFAIDQEDRKADDDRVNEKLRKRSVSGKVLTKDFDDMKSEEQAIKPSEGHHHDDERKIQKYQDHEQAKFEFNKLDNLLMKKIGDSDQINLRKTDSREEHQPQQKDKPKENSSTTNEEIKKTVEGFTDIIQTKSLVYSREEHQPQQKDKPKENLEAPDTSNNLNKLGQTASGVKQTYQDNAHESFLRRIMERVDNTTKLPQKHSKETRLTIGNINIQITNSSTVNNGRNVNIKETGQKGNSEDLGIWGNTFDKTYYWKFRYT